MVVIPEERFIQRDSSSGYFFPFPLLATTTGHQQQGDEKLEQIRMVQDLSSLWICHTINNFFYSSQLVQFLIKFSSELHTWADSSRDSSFSSEVIFLLLWTDGGSRSFVAGPVEMVSVLIESHSIAIAQSSSSFVTVAEEHCHYNHQHFIITKILRWPQRLWNGKKLTTWIRIRRVPIK